jgi:hypothetical protein
MSETPRNRSAADPVSAGVLIGQISASLAMVAVAVAAAVGMCIGGIMGAWL